MKPEVLNMYTTVRSVTEIVPTHIVREGGGFKVRRPYRMGRVLSPFLLIDEMGPVDYGPEKH